MRPRLTAHSQGVLSLMGKTPKTKKTPKVEVAAVPQYSISLTLGDKTYFSTGATAAEAFKKLPVPAKIVGKGFFSMENGARKFTKLYMPAQLKRLVRPSPMFRLINSKLLERMLR